MTTPLHVKGELCLGIVKNHIGEEKLARLTFRPEGNDGYWGYNTPCDLDHPASVTRAQERNMFHFIRDFYHHRNKDMS